MVFDGIDYRWALVYLALTCTNRDKVDNNLQDVIPRRLRKHGSSPTVLTAEVDEKRERWWYPVTPGKLSLEQKRKVMASVVQQMVKITFATHFYEWEGQIYQQVRGGPIGLRATGPVSRILMDYWAEQVRSQVERCNTLADINPVRYQKVNLHFLKKYVDDCLVALDTMAPGVRWCQAEKAMVWSKECEDADRKGGSEGGKIVSMEEFAKMASSIVNCLKFTYDCPQMNANGTMPVLDTQMWVGCETRTTGIPEALLKDKSLVKAKVGQLRSVVLYKFYQKPMTNKLSNRQSNAIPEQQKVSTTTQEVIRRLKNTSRDLPPEEVENVIMTYMEELGAGGYSEDWRMRIIEAAIIGYERMWELEVKGQGFVNRPDYHTKLKRRWGKLVGKQNWFKGRNSQQSGPGQPTKKTRRTGQRSENAEVEGVLYVPFTPQSVLKRSIQKTEDTLLKNRRVGKVRILERLGPKLSEIMCNPTPWSGQHCGRQGCSPCVTQEGSCRKSNVTYKWTCMTCIDQRNMKVIYIGETARSLWDRSLEHMDDLKRRTDTSVLYRHWQETHINEGQPEFRVEVLGTHRSATERQISEALAIQRGQYDELINNKSEWGMNCLVRHGTVFDREVRTATNVATEEREEDTRSDTNQNVDLQQHQSESTFIVQFRQRKLAARSTETGQERYQKRGREMLLPSDLLAGQGNVRTDGNIQNRKKDVMKCYN